MSGYERNFGILLFNVVAHLASSHFAFCEHLFEPLLYFHLFIWYMVRLDEIQIHDKATEAYLIHSCWWNLNEKCQYRCEVSFLFFSLFKCHSTYIIRFTPLLSLTNFLNHFIPLNSQSSMLNTFLILKISILLHGFFARFLSLITVWTLIYLPSIKMSFSLRVICDTI